MTTPAGWVLTNCAVQSGSADGDSNPAFTFIGAPTVRAACLNGKQGATGSIVSPVISGGCKKLSLNYGFAFGDKKCQFTINIKQNGSVVKTETVKVDPVEKLKAFSYSMDVNVSGDFSIEIVNDALSATASKNTDRVSIWNISWTN